MGFINLESCITKEKVTLDACQPVACCGRLFSCIATAERLLNIQMLLDDFVFKQHAIKRAGGVSALVKLLKTTTDDDVQNLVCGILWNLSSCPVSFTIRYVTLRYSCYFCAGLQHSFAQRVCCLELLLFRLLL
jgi:hypothetical protein